MYGYPEMTLHKLRLVKEFFGTRDKDVDIIVSATVASMLTRSSELATLFKLDAQTSCSRFAQMFRRIIGLTRATYLWPVSEHTGHVLIPGIAELRVRHTMMGVKAEHFALMKAALLQTLERAYPADFTAEVRNALIFVFDVLTKSLTEALTDESDLNPLRKFSRVEHEPDLRPAPADFGHFFPMSAE